VALEAVAGNSQINYIGLGGALAGAFMAVVFTLQSTIVSASETEPYPDWRIERVQQTHDLDGRQAISINNPYGEVRIRGSEDDSLSMFAILQRHKKDLQKPLVRFKLLDATAELTVDYPASGAVTDQSVRDSLDKRRIDIVILVPPSLGIINPLIDRFPAYRCWLLPALNLDAG